MKKKTTKQDKKSTAVSALIYSEIKILGKKFSAQGQTVKEAIENLKVGSIPKVMSVLKVKGDNKEKSRVLAPRQTSRLFSKSPFTREIAIKQISMLF